MLKVALNPYHSWHDQLNLTFSLFIFCLLALCCSLSDTTETSETLKLRNLENRVFRILKSEYPDYAALLGKLSDARAGKVTSLTEHALKRRKVGSKINP